MSRTQIDQFIDDDEEETCPLCVEEFDPSDKKFRPCPCGYQICQFCYNNIKQNMSGTCPACRRVYEDKNIKYVEVTQEEWANYKKEKERKEKKHQAARQKEAQKREADHLSRKHLSGLRVMQKNLVYVTGLQPATREDKLLETLRQPEYFGQYGKIIKIVVSKPKETSHHQPQSIGVYVTFARKEDAENCIAAVNGSVNGNRTLRAQYGTTKYCSAYLRNETCNNRSCMFLHEPGEDQESFTRQDLSNLNVGSTQHPSQSHDAQPPPIQQAPIAAAAPQMSRQQSSEDGNSPRPDVPALPATASWGNKAIHPNQDRNSSRTTTSTSCEASPAISTTAPVQPEQEPRPQSIPPPSALSQELTAAKPDVPSNDVSNVDGTGLVKIDGLAYLQRLLKITDLGFSFDEDRYNEKDLANIKAFPQLIDPNGGAKRKALEERQKHDALERELEKLSAQATMQGPPGLTNADADEASEAVSGSLQLGGEPEERHDGPFGRSQHAIGPPSQQSGLGLGQNFGMSEEFGGSLRSGIGASTAQQQQHNLLQQFKSTAPANSLLNNLSNQPSQGLQHAGNAGSSHVRQTSKFSFANDTGTASTSVKPVAKQKYMNQQNTMMPHNNMQFNQGSSQHSLQQNMHGAPFYAGTGNVQGPPPGLKTTGTPPVSGGGMFAHGNGFATSGLGYGANAAGRNEGGELYRQLYAQSRRDGQGSDGGKQSTSPGPISSQAHSRDQSNDVDSAYHQFLAGKLGSRKGTPTIPPGFESSPIVGGLRSALVSGTGTPRVATPVLSAVPNSSAASEHTAAESVASQRDSAKLTSAEQPPSSDRGHVTKSTTSEEVKSTAVKNVNPNTVMETDNPPVVEPSTSSSKPTSVKSPSAKIDHTSINAGQKVQISTTKLANIKDMTEEQKHFSPPSTRRQPPGKLEIPAAATAAPVVMEKKSIKGPLDSVPATPAESTGSAMKKTPAIVRLVQTPKVESPIAASATSVTSVTAPPLPAAVRRSRAPSVASVNIPGTPQSFDASETASITSASISRASSPPLDASKGVSKRTKTKSQAKKERQEKAKAFIDQKIEEAVKPDEPVHEPVLGRKKKTKKASKTPTTPSASSAAAKKSMTEKAKEDEDIPEGKVLDEMMVKSPEVETPATAAAEPDDEVPKRASISPSAIIADLQARGELSPAALDLFRSMSTVSQRSEITQADLDNRERPLTFTHEMIDKLAAKQPVRLGGHDNRASSRALVTADGKILWNMTEEMSHRYSELTDRIAKSDPRFRYRHQPSNAYRSSAPAVSLPSFEDAVYAAHTRAQQAAAGRGKTKNPAEPHPGHNPVYDDPNSYNNKFIMPLEDGATVPPSTHPRYTNTRQDAANIANTADPSFVFPQSLLHEMNEVESEEGITGYEGFVSQMYSGLERDLRSARGGNTNGAAVKGRSMKDLEDLLMEAKRETEKLERQLGSLVKRNKKMLG